MDPFTGEDPHLTSPMHARHTTVVDSRDFDHDGDGDAGGKDHSDKDSTVIPSTQAQARAQSR